MASSYGIAISICRYRIREMEQRCIVSDKQLGRIDREQIGLDDCRRQNRSLYFHTQQSAVNCLVGLSRCSRCSGFLHRIAKASAKYVTSLLIRSAGSSIHHSTSRNRHWSTADSLGFVYIPTVIFREIISVERDLPLSINFFRVDTNVLFSQRSRRPDWATSFTNPSDNASSSSSLTTSKKYRSKWRLIRNFLARRSISCWTTFLSIGVEANQVDVNIQREIKTTFLDKEKRICN